MKSVTSRLRSQYNVSVAEVEDQDLWQLVTLGVACVSNHNQHVEQILAKVIGFITNNYPELEIVDRQIEIFSGP